MNPNRRLNLVQPFSAENQPSNEAKSLGHKKSFRSALLVRALLDRTPEKKFNRIKKQAAAFFQVDEQEIDNEVLLLYSMIVRAIEKQDVAAFNAVMDRAYGKPLLRINEEWTPPETAGLKLTNGREITL